MSIPSLLSFACESLRLSVCLSASLSPLSRLISPHSFVSHDIPRAPFHLPPASYPLPPSLSRTSSRERNSAAAAKAKKDRSSTPRSGQNEEEGWVDLDYEWANMPFTEALGGGTNPLEFVVDMLPGTRQGISGEELDDAYAMMPHIQVLRMLWLLLLLLLLLLFSLCFYFGMDIFAHADGPQEGAP